MSHPNGSGLAFATRLLLLAGAASVHAVSLSVPFGNHMVLQRNAKVPVWGKGSAGEAVTVSFNGQTKTATTASNGTWKVLLDPMVAGGPFRLTAKGSTTVTLSDVMVGEVWQCAGQSNMDTRMNYTEYPNLADSIKKANYPKLRYLTMRQPNQTIQWQAVTPSTVGGLSATGYFFGRQLLDNLDGVAVGLLVTAVGGTTIAQWMDPETVAGDAGLKADATSGTMYDAWVKSVVGYAIAGTAWYQGENDCSGGRQAYYAARLPLLLKGWRKVWGQGDFPFLVAQLAFAHDKQTVAGTASNFAVVREAQRRGVEATTNSWLAVNIDIGSTTTLHFPDKPTAGKRLGLLARGGVYKETGLSLWQSPQPKAAWLAGSTAKILFGNTGNGLATEDGKAPSGFELAGADGKWVWGTATRKGDTVEIVNAAVTKPTQVRHAWADNPIRNLRNAAGIPAGPFEMALAAQPPASLEGRAVAPIWRGAGNALTFSVPSDASALVLELHDLRGNLVRREEIIPRQGRATWNLSEQHGIFVFRATSSRTEIAGGRIVLP